MIPYVAALIAMIFVAYRSDRTLERRYHAAIPVMIAGTSLILLGATSTPVFLSVIFWCFAAAGVYSLLPPFWSMPNEFLIMIFGGCRDRVYQLVRKYRRFRWRLRHGSNQQTHRKVSRRTCCRGCVVVHFGDADTRGKELRRRRWQSKRDRALQQFCQVLALIQ